MLDYLKKFANDRKLEWVQDDEKNLVIKKAGTSGGEKAPTVVIQGHIDMVCEKNQDKVHDFFNDPLSLQLTEDGWLKADGTTLGSDNGIGVAAALAFLDLPATEKLPPLECLFTVDEETGLTGAFNISPSILEGRVMLNLDTEDWGKIFIGCAGGGESTVELPVTLETAPSDSLLYELRVEGLSGGHSGITIHEGRGNAVQLCARAADQVIRSAVQSGGGGSPAAVSSSPIRLVELTGGDKHNAIPREASAFLQIPAAALPAAQAAAQAAAAALTAEYGLLETGMLVQLRAASKALAGTPSDCVLTAEAAARVLTLVLTLPHGVVKMSHAVEGLVETSNNVASLRVEVDTASSAATYHVLTSTRSSLGPAIEAVRDNIERLGFICGGKVNRRAAYPGWNPNLDSKLLELVKAEYAALLGAAPEVNAIHAGLECGILGEKFPGMDMVSLGPTIRGAHTPEERVEISTVKPFWDLTLNVLRKLADK